MASGIKIITKTIPSRTDHLSEVRAFVSEAASAFGFSDEDIANISLAVDEACTNIIKHAYQNAPDKEIEISVIRNKKNFEIRIVDFGRQFNPQEIKAPDLRRNLAQHRRGGLGVYLMKRLMDKVEYSFMPGKHNEVRLIKYLQKSVSIARR
ncbi:MAG: ATP-binding protein [Ignavibacteriales bacterium]|nr:ATP-binding protein [Ignavibacteriales bacterium]